MPKNSTTAPASSNLSRADIELLVGLKQGLDTLVQQVAEFRQEYKQQTIQIRERQDEQFEAVMKRVTDIETWRAMNLQPERMLRWDQTTKTVDDYLDEKHVKRRERIFASVEPHINKDGHIESLIWLNKTRDRWGFLLTIIGLFLSIVSGLFYRLIDQVILPWLTGGK